MTYENRERDDCPECEGSGTVINYYPSCEDPYESCKDCQGTGYVWIFKDKEDV